MSGRRDQAPETPAAIDSRALRRALGQFATGVTIITALDPDTGAPIGRTANSFSSVSLDPPLVLWSVNRASRSAPAFVAAPRFAVNVLSADQIDISGRFASPTADKFAGVDWRPGLGGVPLLPEVSAVFECRKAAEHAGGDHVVILGEVERFARYDRPGLVFAEGRYGLVVDHPIQDVPSAEGAPAAEPHPYDDFLIPLLFRAYEALFASFSVLLDAAGATGPEMRILAILSIRPGCTFERLMRATYLGEQTAEDALARLVAEGLVSGERTSGLDLTQAGRERLRELIRLAQQFEAEQLGEIGPTELARLKALLRRLSEDGQS